MAKASVRRPGSSSRATDEARKSIHSKFEVPVPTVCLAGTAGVRKTEIEVGHATQRGDGWLTLGDTGWLWTLGPGPVPEHGSVGEKCHRKT